MLNLRIPSKTEKDNFNLEDFKSDFNDISNEFKAKENSINELEGLINKANETISQLNRSLSNAKEIMNSNTSSIRDNSSAIETNASSISDISSSTAKNTTDIANISEQLAKPKTFIRAHYGVDTDGTMGWSDMKFPVKTQDTKNEYDPSTGKITVKEPGLYILNATILYKLAVPGGQYFLEYTAGDSRGRFAGAKFGTNQSFMVLSGSVTLNITTPNTVVYVRQYLSTNDTVMGGVSYSYIQLAQIT